MYVLFPTLRSVGYEKCEHPRISKTRCADCGALYRHGEWFGGNLHTEREPLLVDAR